VGCTENNNIHAWTSLFLEPVHVFLLRASVYIGASDADSNNMGHGRRGDGLVDLTMTSGIF
jgi:hypothetical protein